VSGGHSFSSLSLGYAYTCGVTTDGAGYCWGDAQSGKLGGNYRSLETETPVNVDPTLSWLSIEASGATTCGVADPGHLYCWGVLGPSNVEGPEGSERCEQWTGKDGSTNSTPCSYTPLRVELTDPLGADTVFVQTSGTCALTDAGSLYCYDASAGTYGSLSGLGPFETITSFGMHSCALTASGTAWCWGSNWSGQLGDGTRVERSTPVTVSGGHIWDQIVVGSEHTCGLAMGQAWCWGCTSNGEAGTTILTPQLTPAKVHGQD